MLLFRLPFKLNASWSGQTPLFSQFFFHAQREAFWLFWSQQKNESSNWVWWSPAHHHSLSGSGFSSSPFCGLPGQDVCRDSPPLLQSQPCSSLCELLSVSVDMVCYLYLYYNQKFDKVMCLSNDLDVRCRCSKAILTSQTLLQRRGLRMTC